MTNMTGFQHLSPNSPVSPLADLSAAVETCPEPYVLDHQGLYLVRGETEHPITLTPIWPQAMLRDKNGATWSVAIAWLDPEGHQKERVIPFADLRWDGAAIKALVDWGLIVLPGRDRDLLTYLLLAAKSAALPKLLIHRRLGFLSLPFGESERLGFMLPDRCLVPDQRELKDSSARGMSCIFHPATASKTYLAYRSSGTLEEWQDMIVGVRDSSASVFAVCAGLAGPFVDMASAGSVLFHLFGRSSRGKTIALQLSASAWGCAIDPEKAGARPALVERWNTTSNAIENIAAAHSGIGMALDELGSSVEDKLSIYNLLGGRGKARMNDLGGMREQNTWSLLIMSSGEVTIEYTIEATNRRKAKSGELIRACDIPLDELAVGNAEADPQAGQRMEQLKDDLARIYGTAGPVLVQWILDAFPTEEALRHALSEGVAACHEALVESARAEGMDLTSAQVRALRRFALVLLVGCWATDSRVLPFAEEEVHNAVEAVAMAWLRGLPKVSDVELAIDNIRGFVMKHHGQFTQRLSATDGDGMAWSAPTNARGLIKDDLLLLTDEQFSAAWGEEGVSRRELLRTLAQRGILKTEESGRYRYRIDISELGIKRMEFYALRLSRLLSGDDEKRDGDQLADAA